MCGASNYVAKLSADLLSAENLESLGHIFDFTTLPVRLQGRYIPERHTGISVARFASVLRAFRFHRRISSTLPRDAARLSTTAQAVFTALPQGPSLQPGFCSPSRQRLSGPIRTARHLVTFSLPGRLYVTSLLCRTDVYARPRPMTSGSRLSTSNPS
jgi:hypothetical protein